MFLSQHATPSDRNNVGNCVEGKTEGVELGGEHQVMGMAGYKGIISGRWEWSHLKDGNGKSGP